MPIDHMSIAVPHAKFEETKKFYVAALAPIKYSIKMEFGSYSSGFGAEDAHNLDFWLDGVDVAEVPPTHFAFSCKTNADVDACYAAAIAAGGKDNGKPGLRERYHPKYYGAFVIDPTGHKTEFVNHSGGKVINF